MTKHKVDNAIADYSEAIRLDPKFAVAYYERGNAWAIQMQYDKAIADYSEAIRIDPKFAVAYFDRGNAWADGEHEHDKAIADYCEAIRLDPKHARAYYARGDSWATKREDDKAIADYSEAIRIDPKKLARLHGPRHGLVGGPRRNTTRPSPISTRPSESIPKTSRLLQMPRPRLGEEAGVRQGHRRLQRGHPDPSEIRPDAYCERGLAWQDKQEYDKAIADFNEVIRLDAEYDRAYYNRGLAWQSKQEYDKAIADFNEAIRLDPRQAYSYHNRAWIWATCPDAKYRDGKRAVESATKACELSEWKDPDDMDTLAAACAEAGDFDAAVQWQSKAIELQGDEKRKADYRARLTLYREKKPYRESPRSKS